MTSPDQPWTADRAGRRGVAPPQPRAGPAEWLFEDTDGAVSLLGGRSASSGLHHFPPANVCPYSGADDVEVVALPRRGSLWAWTAVTAAPPGYDGPVPFGLGIVELDGIGLRVVGRLTIADPAALQFGQPMVVVRDRLPGGPDVWAFAPAADGAAA
jgi:uncharacterized OB-fold protein